ncbi:penicillin-binding protein 1C [Capnocytophaga catalasegens]|uniref:peptidoglycan glycosyltransferase n=1 Tax=Capnocytophaga catalasegens TaxID=1004260 RepID=A0AAV5AXI6_9FLAO|nr:penicillin-binding protein 1C [Capnocytophaga catalasegens]GIZ15693.1 penicillin-binding protein 1C [Capnocytophaga catalasegens]GJM50080.1 penicillin-binding protein 1C [Capnocytophaga catalasegens]GJM53095.1 penicillin-binding protein 1C [Capnocytophaga catalasegens]
MTIPFKKIFRTYKIRWILLGIILIAYFFCLPKQLFNQTYSTIVESREGKLLGAKIALDGQWRFPERDSIPLRFEKALLLYEDEYFYYHWGINPVSIGKALGQNIRQGHIVRGGSTLTQQVIRLARQKSNRTYIEKIIEAIQATRLEFRYSKQKILALYASHAPFGGNVVGIDMAAWRYFGLRPEQLSWAESTLLAVLPNAPGLIYPGTRQLKLKEKRDKLLLKLYQKKIIDLQTYELAILEPLPEKPHPLPQEAPHFVERVAQEQQGTLLKSTLDFFLQQRVNEIVAKYYTLYKQFEVYNMAVLITDVKTHQIVAYIGNTPTDKDHQKDVDITRAPRSTGSILKPFLYGAMLDTGELLPSEIVPDVPTHISGYTPQNFEQTYEGAVPANEALTKSLNIPFVLLLQKFGLYRFYEHLQKHHLTNINKHPDHYGLSLILGGAESNLWDISQAYTNMASELNYFNQNKMYKNPYFVPLQYHLQQKLPPTSASHTKNILSAGAIWRTFETLTQVNRPLYDSAWRYYNSSQRIAWKTGTSFGNRDAWAVGITAGYVVSVWVGNASGEGRPELTGANNASPILFDIFGILPKHNWFEPPLDDLETYTICANSGLLASEICPKQTIKSVAKAPEAKLCNYHKLVHLSKDKKYQVNTDCDSWQNISTESYFVLPPIMEWYYKKNHINYKSLPPLRTDCASSDKQSVLDFIYPKHGSVIYQTTGFGGLAQPIVSKIAYTGKDSVFWYLDDQFLGQTLHYHEMTFRTTKGEHFLKIIDNQGNEKTILIIIK